MVRKEIRQTVVEQEVYIAEDGSEFYDADDCEAWENRLVGKRLKMYDYDGFSCDCVDGCWYVKLDTQEEIASFKSICNYDGFSCIGIDGPGVYMYTEGNYSQGSRAWTNISKIFENIAESEDHVSGN